MGGIGADYELVKVILEEHPDVFESRTGDEAKALGRKPQATLWQIRGSDDPDEQHLDLDEEGNG